MNEEQERQRAVVTGQFGPTDEQRTVETQPLIDAMNELADQVRRLRTQQRNWKIILRNGILAGLGGVLGATVVVSLLIWILQPLKYVQGIGPAIDKIDRIIQKTK